MLSVMNSSNLTNFGTDTDKPRVSDGREFEFRHSDDVKEEKFETRVSNVRSKSKMEKLTMNEDELAKNSYGKMEGKVPDFGSAYARIDEGAAARMSEAFGSEAEKALSYGFEPGDMVWGKVKSHPWWPGHVFNEALANGAVRRTKREGHVLVAFFGDSSYGWFDPAELIPFDPHYAEKSRQSNSKTFAKASEEAIDEASRRCALGLTCRCRNPFNFRPTHVRSYFAVDVPGFEAGAVYSLMQIKQARERFQSRDALEFVQELALRPMSFNKSDIEAIKKKATIFAYRKATFEEFDETYAQAFGMHPERPGRAETEEIAKVPTRGALSGPMVVAEALNEKKSTSKSSKAKEQSKKDKYLLKRRDEPNEKIGSNHVNEVPQGIFVSSPNEGVTTMTHEEYIFQKRSPVPKPDPPVEPDRTITITRDDIKPVESATSPDTIEDGRTISSGAVSSTSSSSENVDDSPSETKVKSDGEDLKLSDEFEYIDSPRLPVPEPMKKNKVLKRPTGEVKSEKKKKKKKESQLEATTETSNKRLKAPKEEETVIHDSDFSLEKVEICDTEVELEEVINDMLGLALDPFHGAERNSATNVRNVLLRFRSLVYQKSLVSAPSEAEALESYVSKPSPSTVAADTTPDEDDVRGMTPKQPKYLRRPDDPTKAGRKRSVSDRQEEKSAKRLKKLDKLKSLAAEKKVISQKISEKKNMDVDIPVKPMKPRKPESVEPGMVVMRFPEKVSLPSSGELKARFGRFGPLDLNALRIFWKTNMCRVVFVNKAHAREAYNYAIRNRLFGGYGKVSYQLRDVGGGQAASEWNGNGESMGGDSVLGPRPGTPVQQWSRKQDTQLKSCLKRPGEEAVREVPRVKFMLEAEEGGKDVGNNNHGNGGGGGSSSSSSVDVNSKNMKKVISQTLPSHNILLPFPPRVQESRAVVKIEQKVVEPIKVNNFVSATTTTTSSSSSILSTTGMTTTTTSSRATMSKKIDISHEMLSLLMRCNDIVSDVKGMLGYAPYHPL